MHENKEEKLLNEILPNVAAQLRGSLGNIHVAMQHLAPTGGEDTAAERDLAIINQSYYRLLRVVNNLSAEHLTESQTTDTTETVNCNFNAHDEIFLPHFCVYSQYWNISNVWYI